MERGFFRAGDTAFDSGSASVPVAPFGVPPNGSETRADAQICASDVRPAKDAGCPFPLPAGEGQGEGERDAANPNGRTNFASSARPAPRFRVGNGIERAQSLSKVEARARARVAKCSWLLSGDEFSIPAPSPSAGERENGSLASNACLRFCRLS